MAIKKPLSLVNSTSVVRLFTNILESKRLDKPMYCSYTVATILTVLEVYYYD